MRFTFLLVLTILPLNLAKQSLADSSPPASCVPTPIHYGANRSVAGAPPDVPWIVATPKSAHIIGFLFFVPPGATGQDALMRTGGRGPNGRSDKILWYITRGRPTRTLTITGKNLSSSDSMRQTFPVASSGYPSILDIPTAGCWKLTIRSGKIRGHVTFQVLSYQE